MTAAAPWSVKGINPKAREVAKDHARRSGMTLGEWLNRVILEDDVPEEVTSEDHFGTRPRRPLMETPKSYMARQPSSPGSPYQADEFGRIAFALDRLTDRIEASETRTGLAISGVEHSVRHAMARIETAEREQMAVAARVEQATERLRRMESEPAGPRSAEAMRALEVRVERAEAVTGSDPTALIEAVIGRLGERLAIAEGRTSEALESLRGSLSELDQRMGAGSGGDIEQRFAALADQLTQRVDDARSEIAERLATAGPGQMEARLGEMAAQLAGAEQRSARAIEAMGREVLSMAETLNARVHSAEQRSAKAIEQVGGEIARIAGAVEVRLGRTDQLHAEALERLGGEIGKITERLTDRIIQSERRAAQAIDDVGEQVSKVTERIEQRHERASSDIAERIKQSEARTAQLLEQARERFQVGPAAPAAAVEAPSDAAVPEVTAGWDTFAEAVESEDEPAALAETPSIFGPEFSARAELLSQPALDPGNPAFGEEDFEAADRFAPIPESADDAIVFETASTPTATPELSTREVIEQARAAARAASPPSLWKRADDASKKGPNGKRGGGKKRERSKVTAGGGLFANLKARPISTWQTALMVAGGAAFLSVGAAGVVLLEGSDGKAKAPTAPPPSLYAPRAAVALTPQAAAPAPAVIVPEVAAEAIDPVPAAFVATKAGIEKGAPGALARLKALAEADYGPAQLYLGGLYASGDAGVLVNATEARRWTARAAENGEAPAMHNLAMYFYDGQGGVKDPVAAAKWFRQAADRGIVDSQFNLAMLYRSGAGAPRDLAEAYKWFTIAAMAGDKASLTAATELQPKLTKPQMVAAEAAAERFQPAAAPALTAQNRAVAQASVSVVAAQKILGRLGYYKGKPDGAVSGDLKLAVIAYQRAQGLAPTGALDGPTASRLSVFTR